MTTNSCSYGSELDGSDDVHGVERLGRVLKVQLPEDPTAAGMDALLDQMLDEYEARVQGTADLDRQLADLAHKMNNPLTALMGRTQLLRMNPDTDDKTRRTAEVIEESATRIAEFVRELSAIAHRGDR